MTFSITGFCGRSKMAGVAIATSSICVASRCPWVRAGVGAVATQNVTDPGLGAQLLDLIESGKTSAEALQEITARRKHIEYRQLTAVDADGNPAYYSGSHILGIHAVSSGRHCVAAGNLLANESVTQAMTDCFDANPDLHLAERLLLALRAGADAGGEMGPTHSAGIKVADRQSWPLVDLRVDWSQGDPVDELIAIWRAYQPQMNDYVTRAIDPPSAPGYGVPGDP